MNLTLLALLLFGCVVAIFGLYILLHGSRAATRGLQSGEIQLAEIVELRGVRFKNFSRLFSDDDYRSLRAEPTLMRLANQLKKERKRLALRWLAALQADVFALWRLRRLLLSFGVSQGLSAETIASLKVVCILCFIFAFRVCVFAFGPFAFHGMALWARGQIETYTRSCQAALWRLPKHQLADFFSAWRSRQVMPA